MSAIMPQYFPHSGNDSRLSRTLPKDSGPTETVTSLAQDHTEGHLLTPPRQSIAPQERRLQDYLREMTRVGALSENTASLAQKAWNELKALMASNLLVPVAGIGPDSQVLYTWDRREHHFELEIFPDGLGEFFYMNRKTDAVWEQDYTIGESIPVGVKSKLRIFGLYDT